MTIDHCENRSRLLRTKRSGPLSVQKPFYPEGKDCCHLYLLHPPAGIVSGDTLNVTIKVNSKAHVLVTTPGANRFYRARSNLDIGDPKQRQTTYIHIQEEAICEHFPLETIVYNQADAHNKVQVNLQSNSIYLGWDISCLGLPSRDEYFTQGKFSQLCTLSLPERLLFHDRVVVDMQPDILRHPAGLASKPVFASFVAYAPEDIVDSKRRDTMVEELRERVLQLQVQNLVSVTTIKQLLIIRYLGFQAQQCKDIFVSLREIIRPNYIGKKGVQPRIWLT